MNDTSANFIQLRGPVGEAELNATSPLEMTALGVETAATTFSVCTDQAGLIGLVQHLHSRGMYFGPSLANRKPYLQKKKMSAKTITRQGFLKTGCLSMTAAGLTICGVSTLIPNPDPASIDLPTSTYGVRTMKKRILVAYTSALGSTDDVAAEIGKTLSANGISVDVKPIQGHLHAGYQAVLIGSAVWYGNWLPGGCRIRPSQPKSTQRAPGGAVYGVHFQYG